MNTFCGLFSFYIVNLLVVYILDNVKGYVKEFLYNSGQAVRLRAV
jgi:hypothetical protein